MEEEYRFTSQQSEEEQEADQFPDQRLFEPDPVLENRPPSRWRVVWRCARLLIAAVVVVSLLYISGVYQALLLTPTPSSVTQDELPAKTEGEILSVPARIVVLDEDGSLGSARSQESVARLAANANSIWNQARVKITLADVRIIPISTEQKDQFMSDPQAFITSLPGHDPKGITIVLTGTLSGLNGIAFGGVRGLAVADVTSHYDFRTLAHELGHLFGLSHTQVRTRLMAQGSYGTELTSEEIRWAREHIRTHF